ncbi:MAG: SIS domain-containing protein [Armatimonadota bacterium]|nr:SIS domain-containing protein [Armatimonadota bacterium]MDR7518580.1 SIS domain-containing protein [Armatimonadota bacterium]MDR7549700.1 SIS domain-containing protein [Armatimonadota bacterium]
MVEQAQHSLRESTAALQGCLERVPDAVADASRLILDALRRGRKAVLFGNGGSAADAQHLAADLVGRFGRQRAPVPAVALTADTAVLTAVGNDYGFDRVFARQVEALVGAGDVVIAISTSGRSANVVEGVRAARRTGARVVVLTGSEGGALARLADVVIRVPSTQTARIQEAHIAIGHAICAIVEAAWVRRGTR